MKSIKNLDKAYKDLVKINDSFEDLEDLNIESLNNSDTVVVYVDMIKGFTYEGIFRNERSNLIIDNVKSLQGDFERATHVYLVDSHTEDSVEFDTYKKHGIKGTSESEFIDDLYKDHNSYIVHKNSVNGYFSDEFPKDMMLEKKNFIIVGLVTDICVMNFVLSLKASFNEINKESNMYVPQNCVETFDLDFTIHNAELMNLFALYNMRMNGINIVKY